METSFKPVNIEGAQTNQNNTKGDVSYSYKGHEEDSGMGFFQITLITVTVVMFLIAGGIFSWRISLNSGIENKRQELDTKQQKIGVESLDEIKKISSKFHTAKNLIENYPFVSDIFKVLEHSVESGIVYNKFDTHTDTVTGNYYVDVSGTSPSYRTLIQQIDILKTEPSYLKYFSSTEVGDFKPNSKGNIDFSLKIKSNIKGITPLDVLSDLSKSKTDNTEAVNSTTVTPVIPATNKQKSNPVTPDQQKLETPPDPNVSGI